MSIHVMAWVQEHAPEDLEVSEMFIAVTLAGFADDTGCRAFPSVSLIQRYTHLSERTVRLSLKELLRRGVVEVQAEATNRHPKMYRFPLYGGATVTPPNAARGAVVAPLEDLGVQPLPVRGATTAPKPSENKESDRRSRVDPEFRPDAKGFAFAETKGWDAGRIEFETERFLAHHERMGSLMVSWPAAWRTWVLNGIKFDERDGKRSSRPRSAADMNRGGTGRVVL